MTTRKPFLLDSKCIQALPLVTLIEQVSFGMSAGAGAFADHEGVSQTGWCYGVVPRTLCYAGSLPWLKRALAQPQVSAIITSESILRSAAELKIDKAVLVAEDPGHAFVLVHNAGIHSQCYDREPHEGRVDIHPTAKLHPTVVMQGDIRIAANVEIGPLTTLHGPLEIGEDTRIDEHCSIGTQGLFAKRHVGRRIPFASYGGVRIGRNCHVHARTNIARSPHFGSATEIHAQVSIGIGCNVGHDCVIGELTTMASTSCVCGHSEIGPHCWIGAAATVCDNLSVGQSCKVRAGAVVATDLADHADVSGNFAVSHRKRLLEFQAVNKQTRKSSQ